MTASGGDARAHGERSAREASVRRSLSDLELLHAQTAESRIAG
ncbi:MAG TPA: hypothetical protein VGB81_06200 [Devosia sp.]